MEAATLDAPGRDFDLVINATSASLDDEVPAVPAEVLRAGTLAYDLVYSDDRTTAFTRWAADHGATVSDGQGMLVEQARESWLLWFGEWP